MQGTRARGGDVLGIGAIALAAAICLALAGCADDDAATACDATTLTGTLDLHEDCGNLADYVGCDWTVYVDTDADSTNGHVASASGEIDGAAHPYSVDVTGLGGEYFLYVEGTCGAGFYNADPLVAPDAANAAVTCGAPLAMKYCD
jgi:hypothetical protein